MNGASCVYEGWVRHRRYAPRPHEFRYRLFFMYVDLDEAEAVFHRRWLWSVTRPNLAWLRRSDHLFDHTVPLGDEIRALVRSATGRRASGPIRMLTQFRYFGFVMNPISLYYCFDTDEQLEFVVAEVTNTPWNERRCYVLEVQKGPGRSVTCSARKQLHVSPFMDMNYEYRFRLTRPGRRLAVHIENHSLTSGGADFDATLTLRRRPITGRQLCRVLCRYPLITAQIFARIYWQALRLWCKGLPVYRRAPQGPWPRPTSPSQSM